MAQIPVDLMIKLCAPILLAQLGRVSYSFYFFFNCIFSYAMPLQPDNVQCEILACIYAAKTIQPANGTRATFCSEFHCILTSKL